MSHRGLLGCGMFAGLAFCTQSFAAEGKFDHMTCYAGPSHILQQGDGIIAGSYDSTAMMPGQEGTPYYNMSGRCLGQFTIINGDYSESGSCRPATRSSAYTPARAMLQKLKGLGELCRGPGSLRGSPRRATGSL
jgi:hypothetical protein